MNTAFKSTLLGLLAMTLVSVPAISMADRSCSRFLVSKASEARGGWYSIELTIHREDVFSVSYGGDTVGWLLPRPDGSFVGHVDEIYSERITADQQPFDINYADDVNLKLDKTGRLHLYYGFAPFVSSVDLNCKGTLLTTYVPNFGVVTLSFRNMYKPAQ